MLVVGGYGDGLLFTLEIGRSWCWSQVELTGPKPWQYALFGCTMLHGTLLCFGGHEMYFETLTCWTAALLGKDRLSVPKLVNLENNNYYHVLEHNLSLTSAIYVFLIKHVTSPPAHLFLSSPEAYLRQLGCAGGIVLLQFLLFVGAPTLRWHYAGRAGDGDEVARLHALAVHLYRGICHKTASARISLYTLMGMHCAHPKLQQLLRATVSMSVLGRDGGNMYVDRFVEFVNFLLKKRNSCHAAFDMALQLSRSKKSSSRPRSHLRDARPDREPAALPRVRGCDARAWLPTLRGGARKEDGQRHGECRFGRDGHRRVERRVERRRGERHPSRGRRRGR
jgi:hypothetical protein